MFRLQNLRHMRIVGLHQRTGLQACAEKGYPERSHCHRHRRILQNSPAEMEVARGILEVRLDQPKQIECLRKHNPLADQDKPLLVALDIP